jgi:uncharacterized protein (TIGR00251 family)
MTTPTDAVHIRASDRGVRIGLRVKVGGRSDRLIGAHGGALKLEVKAVAERGRANAAVIRLLAGLFEVTRSAVDIVSGSTSKDKLVEIRGVDANEVVARLRAAGISQLQITN